MGLAYFADLPNGETIAFKSRREKTFVDCCGIQRYRVVEPQIARLATLKDGSTLWNTGEGDLCGYAEGHGWIKITRTVNMKSNPSRHECDARCMYAKGRTMNCECACGGAAASNARRRDG